MLPETVAIEMDTKRRNAKRGTPILIEKGIKETMGFGTGPQGEPDFGVASMTGTGRTSGWRLSPEEQDWGILNLKNQGDWHDATIKGLAFYGNNNGHPIVNFSGYSMRLQDLFIRGSWRERFGNGTGLKINGGQHYLLDNIQCELIEGVGIHLHNVLFAKLSSCNGESCDIGLLLTKEKRAGMIHIDQFYAEASKIGILSKGVTFRLDNGVFTAKSDIAVELNGCQDCHINMSQGAGMVVLDEASFGNEIIVGNTDSVVVVDKGEANTIRTVATPKMTTKNFETPIWEYNNFGVLQRKVLIVDAQEDVNIEHTYKTEGQARIMVQAYDLLYRQHYNPHTGVWGDDAPVIPLPYVSKQQCTEAVKIRTDIGRRIQLKFLVISQNPVYLYEQKVI